MHSDLLYIREIKNVETTQDSIMIISWLHLQYCIVLVVRFVDSCKFLHDRSDYKSGWQLDREFEENEKPEGIHTHMLHHK